VLAFIGRQRQMEDFISKWPCDVVRWILKAMW
jgi:hypothetical protein